MDFIHDPNSGTGRALGCLLPKPGFVSAMPRLDTAVAILSDADIADLAKSGIVDGRARFDSSWIKDQLQHGQCNGFAEASSLSKSRVLRGLPRVDLSGAYAYSLINGGQDQGSMLEDGMLAMQKTGVATEATVGPNQIYPKLYDRAKADAEAAKYKGFECYAVKSKQELYTALALGFVCVVGVHVENQFMTLDADGLPGAASGPGNHAVHCDGIAWVSGRVLCTAANSWNTTYGMDGRMNLVYEQHFVHTITQHVFYAIRSTTDGDAPAPPAPQP